MEAKEQCLHQWPEQRRANPVSHPHPQTSIIPDVFLECFPYRFGFYFNCFLRVVIYSPLETLLLRKEFMLTFLNIEGKAP